MYPVLLGKDMKGTPFEIAYNNVVICLNIGIICFEFHTSMELNEMHQHMKKLLLYH